MLLVDPGRADEGVPSGDNAVTRFLLGLASLAVVLHRVADMSMLAGKTATPEAYQELRQAAKDAHPERRATVDNANVTIMVCLELYESKRLRAVVAHRPPVQRR